ncbi:MAG: hypothetical protein WC382_00650 [Methanoregulaceae archaeon]|jgi:predicted MFS family arabinose efflux permease
MSFPSSLQFLSIGLEVLIGILGIAIAVQKKKLYGYLIACTFAMYVTYDLLALMGNAAPLLMAAIFFVATLSILTAVWLIYREQ